MTETSGSATRPSLLSPWRRRGQWIVTLLLLLLPWGKIDGTSLIRIDIPNLSLHFFGQSFRIEELYLVLLFSLILTLFFLLITMLLGRVWCGWLCPQTTLTDIAEWFSTKLGLNKGKANSAGRSGAKFVRQLFYLLLAFLVACNLSWYFIQPVVFFSRLATGQLHYATWIFLLLVTLLIFLDLSFLKRLMCSEFCPYGRFQTALADQSTLALNLPEHELERCIRCNSCVRVCPMKIDIRDGYQVECINCGRCLDACRQVMAKRHQPGLIRYSFGTTGTARTALLNLRALLLIVIIAAMTVVFAVAIVNRPSASLKVAVSHSVPSRILKDGSRATFFNAWVNNRSRTSETYSIRARRINNGQTLQLKGQTDHLELGPGKNLKVDFVLISVVETSRTKVEFILMDAENHEIASARAEVE